MRKEIYDAYQSIKPEEDAKNRMLNNIKTLASNDFERRRQIMKLKAKYLTRIAAAAAAIVTLPTVAYATGLFGLHEVSLGEKVIEIPVRVEKEDAATEDTFITETYKVDMISLQGMADSPEAKACNEWTDFYDSYDADGSIIAEVGNNPTELKQEYRDYPCYTKEMADKIDELCEKYRLKKRGSCVVADDYQNLISQVGIADFIKSSGDATNNFFDGYYYPNGSFLAEGEVSFSEHPEYIIDYQFGRSVKGYFDTTCLNIGNIEDYEQWEYTTKNGETLLLANSAKKALVIVDKEQSFFVVNVFGSFVNGNPNEVQKEYPVTNEDLERLAETFDFSVIP